MILESQDAHVEKSSHFMVCLDGSVVQCVGTQNAGYGNNILDNPLLQLVLARGTQSTNDMSILSNPGYAAQDITPAQ